MTPLALAVALALAVLAGVAAAFTGRAVGEREEQMLVERGNLVATAIDRRTENYTEKLYGIRAAFVAQEATLLSHRAFDDFLRGQDFTSRFAEVDVIGVVEEVRDREIPGFLRRVRSSVRASGLAYPPLRITPPGRRSSYNVISYVHPVPANRAIFGVDANARPGRRRTFEAARDRARPAALPPLPLPQDGPRGPLSLTIALPVYAGLDQSPDRGQRRARYFGVVFLAVRLPDLLDGIVDAARGEDLEVRDGRRLIFDQRRDVSADDLSKSVARPLSTADRPWEVVYGTTEPLSSGAARAVPWLIGTFGVLVALLAGGIVQALTTSRRRAEDLVEERTEDLRRSNQELERFAFVASHDLQQPLRTVSGFLQLLEHQAGPRLDDTTREYVAQALRGSQQMSTLIEDLLTYSRVARDDRPLSPVGLDRAWDAAVDQLRATIDASGARVSRAELPVVPGDAGQLTQAFANLIANAVKYRGDAKPEVRADARRVGDHWEIAVQDNGIGIDPRDHELIFEMFRRLHTENEIEGTGVGLALVKRIVERSGGDVEVQSEPGAGARFVLRMPDASALGEAA